MATFHRRLQVLLDDERFARLERAAARRGSSVATLVREAIDTAYPEDGMSRSEAGRLLLDAEPVALGEWPDLKAEVELMYQVTE